MTKDAGREENERERDGFQGKAYGHPGKTGNHGTTQTVWRDKHNHLVDNRKTAWKDTHTIHFFWRPGKTGKSEHHKWPSLRGKRGQYGRSETPAHEGAGRHKTVNRKPD